MTCLSSTNKYYMEIYNKLSTVMGILYYILKLKTKPIMSLYYENRHSRVLERAGKILELFLN